MKRLERLVSMALVFASRRHLRAAELARQFAVSERTVYRDVRALTSAGFPIEGNAGDGYRVPTSAFLRPLGLTEAEIAALAMGATMMVSADSAIRDALSTAITKLESMLGPAARQRLRKLRAEIHVSASAQKSVGPLGRVAQAVDSREVLVIAYDSVSGGRVTKREVEPLGFVLAGNDWLLMAWCRLRRDVRAFRVDRIRALRSTGERYERREGFSFTEVIERERKKFVRSS
jgi:predicted DNA-binding transcriptional regulator YafY